VQEELPRLERQKVRRDKQGVRSGRGMELRERPLRLPATSMQHPSGNVQQSGVARVGARAQAPLSPLEPVLRRLEPGTVRLSAAPSHEGGEGGRVGGPTVRLGNRKCLLRSFPFEG